MPNICDIHKNTLGKYLQENYGEQLNFVREARKNMEDFDKLSPFTNDRFGERIMRERIKEKASKGYEKYRLPTGETIGKIEGFEEGNWLTQAGEKAIPENVNVGDTILMGGNDPYLVTKKLPNGQIKAMNSVNFPMIDEQIAKGDFSHLVGNDRAMIKGLKNDIEVYAETFDLTGKSNPQAKRYEQWGKFLKNKFGGKEVTDPRGNTWMEIDLNKGMAKLPVEAFGVAPLLTPQETEGSQ